MVDAAVVQVISITYGILFCVGFIALFSLHIRRNNLNPRRSASCLPLFFLFFILSFFFPLSQRLAVGDRTVDTSPLLNILSRPASFTFLRVKTYALWSGLMASLCLVYYPLGQNPYHCFLHDDICFISSSLFLFRHPQMRKIIIIIIIIIIIM